MWPHRLPTTYEPHQDNIKRRGNTKLICLQVRMITVDTAGPIVTWHSICAQFIGISSHGTKSCNAYFCKP